MESLLTLLETEPMELAAMKWDPTTRLSEYSVVREVAA